EGKRAAVQIDEILRDRQAEPRTLFRRLDRIGALAEGGEHNRNLVLGNTGPGILDAEILPARSGPADLEPDFTALWRELDGVAQEVEADLANGALVRPQARQFRLEQFVNDKTAILGAHLEQVAALADHAGERDRFLVELIAAGLDTREVENLVDQPEQV